MTAKIDILLNEAGPPRSPPDAIEFAKSNYPAVHWNAMHVSSAELGKLKSHEQLIFVYSECALVYNNKLVQLLKPGHIVRVSGSALKMRIYGYKSLRLLTIWNRTSVKNN